MWRHSTSDQKQYRSNTRESTGCNENGERIQLRYTLKSSSRIAPQSTQVSRGIPNLVMASHAYPQLVEKRNDGPKPRKTPTHQTCLHLVGCVVSLLRGHAAPGERPCRCRLASPSTYPC